MKTLKKFDLLVLLIASAANAWSQEPPVLGIGLTNNAVGFRLLSGPKGLYAVQAIDGSSNGWRTLAEVPIEAAVSTIPFVDTDQAISRSYRLELLGIAGGTNQTTNDQVIVGVPLPPGRITNLSASAVSSVALKLNWSDPISAAALVEYDIRVSTNAISALNWSSRQRLTNAVPVPGSAGASQSYTVFPLSAGTRYFVGIKVKNAGGLWSSMSNLAVAATGSSENPRVTLEWDKSPDSWVTGYAIHYGTASGRYTVRKEVGNYTYVTVSNLLHGVTYFFVATAYTADGLESLPSNEVSYTAPQ